MTDTTAPGTPPVRCTPDGCFDGDCVPCLDCRTTVHATEDCYAVDCGVVCVPCGRTRYGDGTAHLWGPMWGYPDRLAALGAEAAGPGVHALDTLTQMTPAQRREVAEIIARRGKAGSR